MITRVIEHPARIQFIEQSTQPPIKIKDAVIINVVRHLHVSYRQFRLVDRVPALQGQAVDVRNRPQPESRRRSIRNLVGRVGVVVVQEREERAVPRSLPGEPGEERPVRPSRRPSRAPSSAESRRTLSPRYFFSQAVDHRGRREQVEPAAQPDVAGEDIPELDRVILVVREAPAQAGFPAAVIEVGDKPGRIIAASTQVLGERGVGSRRAAPASPPSARGATSR